MKITITQSDIDEGVQGNCYACPIALAMKRTTGRAWIVGKTHATDMRQSIKLPDAVICWIRDFDAGLPVQPMAFEVEGIE